MPRISKSKSDLSVLQDIALKEIEHVEKEILSAIFFYYQEAKEIVDIDSVSSEFFITLPAQKIFEALKKSKRIKHDTGESYELVDVSTTIKTICKNIQELADTENFFGQLTDSFQFYTLKENWSRMKAFNIKKRINQLAKEIMETPMNYQLIDNQVIKWRNTIDQISLLWSVSRSKTMDEAVEDWEDYIKKMALEDKTNYLKTRYSDLDKKLKSLAPGQLIVIASRPGVGKTTFALNLLHQNLPYLNKTNNPDAWGMGMFSLEMTNISLVGKMISICSFHPFSTIEKVMDGKPIEEWEQVLIDGAKTQLSNTNIFLCDDSNLTLGSLVSNIKKWVNTHNLKVVIIDYLQLITLPMEEEKKHSALYQYQKIGMISRTLKLLSLELNICIITLAQLNRKIEERVGKDKSPLLSDLRESGSIEQDADVVLFLYEDDKKDNPHQTSTYLKIGKNRNGATGTVEFCFDKERGIYKCLGEVD